MYAFGTLDASSDTLRKPAKLFGTGMCPYVFVFFLTNDLEVFQVLYGLRANDCVRKSCRHV